MKKEDLELENENYNTALYLAAAAGNIETVKIMMEVNDKLLSIPGGGSQYSKPQMMPMYTAALFGNHEVVKYMYEKSNDLIEGGWTPATRAWLLEKCLDNNMFDIAIKIVKRYPKLGITNSVLGILARKPEAFVEPDFNIIQSTISWGQHRYKHLFSKMSISNWLPNKKLAEHGNGKVHGNFARKAEKTCSDIGKAIESGKRLYFSSIIGRTINYTRRPIKYVFKVISSKVVPPENKKEALQLLKIIWNDIAKMPKVEIDRIIRGPSESKQVDKPASENVEQAAKLYSERIAKMQFDIQNTIRETPISGKEDQALKLQNLISEQIAKILVENQNVIRGPPTTKKTYYPSRILFVAAEMGNTTFVVELIRQYPDLIWKVNDNGLSIFHIAVKHRHEGIYNLLYEIGSMKDLITPLKDQNGNTMLHLVGKSAKQKRLEDVSGVALQMQRELLWFQEVEAMIPPSYRERKNKEGLTPYELFTQDHKNLVKDGEKWMKDTASQCMVVAALIATIVFAAAFTVPGGYDQDDGIPFFHSKATLAVFVVADAISLFASSASILIFLSILTSRYAERDFLESLPKKLMAGLATLFLSITTMTIAFSVSFFVLYHKGLLWIPILIAALGVMPVLLYVKLQIGLFVDVIRSTYGSRYLFKPRKHLLYYENPKMNQSGVIQLGPIDEQTPLSQQQQNITVPVASPRANSGPNLPQLDLLEDLPLADRPFRLRELGDFSLKGAWEFPAKRPREDYLKIGVPLYEASIKCDWKAAKAILDKYADMKLLRYSITENAETALHVAASAKGPKHVEDFVKNLVELMEKEDLALENKNCNTALYLAAAAGNIKTVKIMMEKNRTLLAIPGGGSMDKKRQLMPLYTAALFGNHEVVKYMYEESKDLIDDGWTDANRSWLLEKCVENDMFDIALKIVAKYKKLASNGGLLGVLARKPEAFSVKQHNFIWRFIIWVFSLIGITVGAYEKECKALQLLKIIWGEIAKNNKNEIDRIIRGPADPIKPDNTSASKRVIQAMQLENLISEHVSKMKDESQNITEGHPDSTNQDPKQHKVDQALKLQQLISKQLVNMHAETQKITKEEAKHISAKVDQVSELEKLISKHIVDMHTETQNIIRGPSALGQEDQAQHLQNLISTHIAKLLVKTKSIIDTASVVPTPKSTYSNRVLFVATEMGNTKFLVELIRLYPDLIWKTNDNGLSVFHIAVKHRHEGIYNLLYEIGVMKDMITPLRDEHENNMLHLVGKIAKKRQLEDVSGFALQMQRELLWFQEVWNMIPPSYRERKNKDDLTPHELFTKEHKDLVIRGEEWMKGTASQCMVVAALIATIVFAAAFTVPGGYAQSNDQASNQKNGVPVFHSKATFMSLPKKLMLGLATLFLSITTMTVAFSVSFFVLYHKGLLWIPILIGALAVLPVLLYIKLQYGLFVDVIRSTYGSRYLFKPRKHVLYYKNPEV
ncbi:ankyrin repeat-containing domain, PGG domain protein [Artemisia annua]|uniref:Ankyrin repeat-containing domain, PGG domain protein n=1 Tax=Artemisia annua TaxID=35608 RepID=A0A2U1LEF2_ARTAN|nr:ankyrin repeat-containing domain, PGG domain protein [Artemisia annua]